MEHLQYFIDPIQKHYVDFAGRATRKQYWMFVSFSVIISIVLGVVDAVIGKQKRLVVINCLDFIS